MEAFKDDGPRPTHAREQSIRFFFIPFRVSKEKRISHRFFFLLYNIHTRSCCCTARFCSARTSFFFSPLHVQPIFFCLPSNHQLMLYAYKNLVPSWFPCVQWWWPSSTRPRVFFFFRLLYNSFDSPSYAGCSSIPPFFFLGLINIGPVGWFGWKKKSRVCVSCEMFFISNLGVDWFGFI